MSSSSYCNIATGSVPAPADVGRGPQLFTKRALFSLLQCLTRAPMRLRYRVDRHCGDEQHNFATTPPREEHDVEHLQHCPDVKVHLLADIVRTATESGGAAPSSSLSAGACSGRTSSGSESGSASSSETETAGEQAGGACNATRSATTRPSRSSMSRCASPLPRRRRLSTQDRSEFVSSSSSTPVNQQQHKCEAVFHLLDVVHLHSGGLLLGASEAETGGDNQLHRERRRTSKANMQVPFRSSSRRPTYGYVLDLLDPTVVLENYDRMRCVLQLRTTCGWMRDNIIKLNLDALGHSLFERACLHHVTDMFWGAQGIQCWGMFLLAVLEKLRITCHKQALAEAMGGGGGRGPGPALFSARGGSDCDEGSWWGGEGGAPWRSSTSTHPHRSTATGSSGTTFSQGSALSSGLGYLDPPLFNTEVLNLPCYPSPSRDHVALGGTPSDNGGNGAARASANFLRRILDMLDRGLRIHPLCDSNGGGRRGGGERWFVSSSAPSCTSGGTSNLISGRWFLQAASSGPPQPVPGRAVRTIQSLNELLAARNTEMATLADSIILFTSLSMVFRFLLVDYKYAYWWWKLRIGRPFKERLQALRALVRTHVGAPLLNFLVIHLVRAGEILQPALATLGCCKPPRNENRQKQEGRISNPKTKMVTRRDVAAVKTSRWERAISSGSDGSASGGAGETGGGAVGSTGTGGSGEQLLQKISSHRPKNLLANKKRSISPEP